MTFRHDDPVPINKNGIVFLNDSIGYVFMAGVCRHDGRGSSCMLERG